MPRKSRDRPAETDRTARAALSLDPRGLLPLGTRALSGVSGGRDSVALLHALVERGEKALVVCHFDHALRPESASEAEFVAELARGYGLPFEVALAGAKPRKKSSIETAAREARYAFFAEAAERHQCQHLYLAHHADDQAETFLFNLLRGSGTTGLGGIRPSAQRGALTLHRPLLGTWREEIDRYIAAHALRFCEDASNRNLQHTRNRLRHEILPQLESALDRNVRTALWRAAELLSADDDFLQALTPDVFIGELKVEGLRALPLALQRRTLRAWLRARGVPQVDFDDVENIRGLLEKVSPARVNLSAGLHVRRRAGKIFVEGGA